MRRRVIAYKREVNHGVFVRSRRKNVLRKLGLGIRILIIANFSIKEGSIMKYFCFHGFYTSELQHRGQILQRTVCKMFQVSGKIKHCYISITSILKKWCRIVLVSCFQYWRVLRSRERAVVHQQRYQEENFPHKCLSIVSQHTCEVCGQPLPVRRHPNAQNKTNNIY